jgi:hypothetical protein
VTLGSSKYHHQDGGTPNTGIRLVLLDHGSMVNERIPSIFYKLSWQFVHEFHYFKVGITQKRHSEIQDIITRVVTFRIRNYVNPHGSKTNGRDPSIFIIFLDSLAINYTTLKMKHREYYLVCGISYFDSLGKHGHN